MKFDHVLNKEELDKLTLDELKAYKKWLEEKKLKDELLKDTDPENIKDANHPYQDLNGIKDAKKSGKTYEELETALLKMQAQLEQMNQEKANGLGSITIDKDLIRHLGGDGDDVAAVAKDLGHALPCLDFIKQATGKRVTDLEIYKRNFPKVDEGKFLKAFNVLEQKNKLEGLKIKTGMDSATAGVGDEWVPTDFASSIIMHIQKSKAIPNALRSFDMPSNPFVWPVSGGNNTTYYVTESLNASDVTTAISNATSAQATFTAGKLANRLELSEELNEDAAFAVFPALLEIVADSLNDGYEKAIIFGDETTSNPIWKDGGSATTTAGQADLELVCDGLIHKALIDSNGSNVNINAASSPSSAIRLILAEMGEGGKNMMMNRVLVGPQFYFAMLDDERLSTMDKIGNMATIITGQVGNVFGMPVFMTGGLPLSDSAGKISDTAANNTLASVVVCDSSLVLIGFRRRLRVARDYTVETDKHKVVTSMRFDVQQLAANASQSNPIGYGYNYPV